MTSRCGWPTAPEVDQAFELEAAGIFEVIQQRVVAPWEDSDMQQIVVGFTQTATAERALQEAAALALRLGSSLHVVTSLDDPSVEIVREFGDEFVIDDFENAEQAIRRSMANLAEAPDFTVAVLDAKPADALIAEAERLNAEMIVVGNVRMQGPGRILGSVGSKVLHHAPCNVLVVKTT